MLKVGDQVTINATIQGNTVIGIWISEVDSIQSGVAKLKIGVVNGSPNIEVPVANIKPENTFGTWFTTVQVSIPTA